VTSAAGQTEIPQHWYNVRADLPFELPRDLPSRPHRATKSSSLGRQIPLELLRQETSRERFIAIPPEVRELYRRWRPSPLHRAARLEARLGTSARIFIKYEGGNGSGSHKLNTALAQAHYYKAAGASRLVTATGAGQWGTALAIACRLMGMACKVFMVATSYAQKPHRRTLMELFGATVVASPSPQTECGARMLQENPALSGSLTAAISEAMEDAEQVPGTRFCIGSGEGYAILHQTVSGLEAKHQLAQIGEYPDIVVGCLGAGSNIGGISFPFLADRWSEGRKLRVVSAESTACPKLTRGIYAYDFADADGRGPLVKMYTLGNRFCPPGVHAGGLRYHAASKIISALYDRGEIEAVAYDQRSVFSSGHLLAETEDILPAPESNHAVHAAVQLALAAGRDRSTPAILLSVSGHGHFDMTAYEEYARGALPAASAGNDEIAASLQRLPALPSDADRRAG
jgi:tryptophan synthase beta chain